MARAAKCLITAKQAGATSVLTPHPDNPVTETGVRSEFSHHGISSRVHQKRADRVHQALDPILVAGPWMVAGGIVYSAVRAMAKRRQ